MKKKITRISTSLMALLRDEESRGTPDGQLESLREDMLELMAPFVESQVVRPAVWGAVLYASDVQALWYQRMGLMQLLCEHVGEHEARTRLYSITEQFRGCLPSAQFASARMRP